MDNPFRTMNWQDIARACTEADIEFESAIGNLICETWLDRLPFGFVREANALMEQLVRRKSDVLVDFEKNNGA